MEHIPKINDKGLVDTEKQLETVEEASVRTEETFGQRRNLRDLAGPREATLDDREGNGQEEGNSGKIAICKTRNSGKLGTKTRN
eukprot:2706083-Pleurochrysis_carterae.AAC.2